jgi:N utilization substance protein A
LFVTRALAPAKVVHIDMFDLEDKMTVVVEDEKLSLAIGRNGQNARLASKLTGWKVNILSETDYNENKRREAETLVPVGQLEGVGEKIRDRLIEADISSVQRLASASAEMLSKIEGLGPKTAEKLIERAKEMVAEIEREMDKREKEAKKEAAEKPAADEKLAASDVFEDDTDYVVDADDMPEVSAPDFDEDIDEDEDESAKGADIDEEQSEEQSEDEEDHEVEPDTEKQ